MPKAWDLAFKFDPAFFGQRETKGEGDEQFTAQEAASRVLDSLHDTFLGLTPWAEADLKNMSLEVHLNGCSYDKRAGLNEREISHMLIAVTLCMSLLRVPQTVCDSAAPHLKVKLRNDAGFVSVSDAMKWLVQLYSEPRWYLENRDKFEASSVEKTMIPTKGIEVQSIIDSTMVRPLKSVLTSAFSRTTMRLRGTETDALFTLMASEWVAVDPDSWIPLILCAVAQLDSFPTVDALECTTINSQPLGDILRTYFAAVYADFSLIKFGCFAFQNVTKPFRRLQVLRMYINFPKLLETSHTLFQTDEPQHIITVIRTEFENRTNSAEKLQEFVSNGMSEFLDVCLMRYFESAGQMYNPEVANFYKCVCGLFMFQAVMASIFAESAAQSPLFELHKQIDTARVPRSARGIIVYLQASFRRECPVNSIMLSSYLSYFYWACPQAVHELLRDEFIVINLFPGHEYTSLTEAVASVLPSTGDDQYWVFDSPKFRSIQVRAPLDLFLSESPLHRSLSGNEVNGIRTDGIEEVTATVHKINMLAIVGRLVRGLCSARGNHSKFGSSIMIDYGMTGVGFVPLAVFLRRFLESHQPNGQSAALAEPNETGTVYRYKGRLCAVLPAEYVYVQAWRDFNTEIGMVYQGSISLDRAGRQLMLTNVPDIAMTMSEWIGTRINLLNKEENMYSKRQIMKTILQIILDTARIAFNMAVHHVNAPLTAEHELFVLAGNDLKYICSPTDLTDDWQPSLNRAWKNVSGQFQLLIPGRFLAVENSDEHLRMITGPTGHLYQTKLFHAETGMLNAQFLATVQDACSAISAMSDLMNV